MNKVVERQTELSAELKELGSKLYYKKKEKGEI